MTSHFFNRPFLLSVKYLGYNGTTLVSTPYGPHWRKLRRIATVELFSTSRILSFAQFQAEEVRSLLCSLFSSATVNTAEWSRVEMKKKLQMLSFSTLMRILDDQKYYGDEKSVNSVVRDRYRMMIEEALLFSGASSVEDFVPWMGWLGLGGTKRKLMRIGKELDEIFQEMVDERRQRRAANTETTAKKEATTKTIVDVMLALQEQEPEEYPDAMIKGMISDQVQPVSAPVLSDPLFLQEDCFLTGQAVKSDGCIFAPLEDYILYPLPAQRRYEYLGRGVYLLSPYRYPSPTRVYRELPVHFRFRTPLS